MNTRIQIVTLAIAAAVVAGCRTRHEINTVSEVKPIHITIDVNVKVDKALNDFFDEVDEADAKQPSEKEGEQQQ